MRSCVLLLRGIFFCWSSETPPRDCIPFQLQLLDDSEVGFKLLDHSDVGESVESVSVFRSISMQQRSCVRTVVLQEANTSMSFALFGDFPFPFPINYHSSLEKSLLT